MLQNSLSKKTQAKTSTRNKKATQTTFFVKDEKTCYLYARSFTKHFTLRCSQVENIVTGNVPNENRGGDLTTHQKRS